MTVQESSHIVAGVAAKKRVEQHADATAAAGGVANHNKKVKTDHAAELGSPANEAFRAGLLDEENASALRSQYDASGPYLHIVIQDLINDDLLRAVRKEITSAIAMTAKETDIYKVNQSGDLANLDGLPADELAQLKNLHKLRNALYSDEFRSFVEKVTGVERLSPSKKDLSHNNYTEGCHLICHDDVIGTRSVSYILYLTDPDEPWRPEEGGALELFPVVSKGTPSVDPTLIIPPKWNQLAMFAVQPGLSFHSVAEVLVPDRSRLSISGWFHVLQPEDMTEEERKRAEENKNKEDDKAPASLDQLTSGDDGIPFEPLQPLPSSADEDDLAPLTAEEIEQLKPFVNPVYLNPKVISQANERFCEESSIQLTSFLQPQLAKTIQEAICMQDTVDGFLAHADTGVAPPVPNYSAGVQNEWYPLGPAHKQRFLTLNNPPKSPIPADTDPTGFHLSALQTSLFPSTAFRRLLSLITSLKTTKHRSWVRRFRPGMDYTLATTSGNSETEPEGVLDVSLCFVSERNAQEKEIWASDEVGGFECYMAPDEGNEDPAQYRAADVKDGGGALLSVSASSNNLNIVMRAADSGGVMKFVKYVSARAPGSRWDVTGEYRYEEDDAEEGAKEEAGEQ
ncbi:hypothetical protein HDV05_002257 [Chytridiales sp. JEL 0842]|nr:hypothetical protein HDV05_002257 [Chytridiales sp. JEL 0842]